MTYNDAFSALGDPTRRALFEALRVKPLSVGELAKGRSISRPAVSQHLKVLERASLVTVTPQGNRRIYAIRREGLQELRDYLDGFWSDVLFAFGSEIRRQNDTD